MKDIRGRKEFGLISRFLMKYKQSENFSGSYRIQSKLSGFLVNLNSIPIITIETSGSFISEIGSSDQLKMQRYDRY